jgi:hypothetical protein
MIDSRDFSTGLFDLDVPVALDLRETDPDFVARVAEVMDTGLTEQEALPFVINGLIRATRQQTAA